MNRSRAAALLCLAGLASLWTSEPVTAQVPLTGRWQGVVFLQRAELETEVEVTFSETENGTVGGSLSFLTNGDLNLPIHDFSRDGEQVRFAVSDQHQVVSTFDGSLSPDQTRLSGDLAENGAHYVFALRRATAPETPTWLRRLSAGSPELKQLFRQDATKVRLLLILGSSCPLCKSGAGIVQHYLLNEVKDPRLAVYVVWEPVGSADTESSATAAGRALSDPRVVQFWAEDRSTGRAFAGILGNLEAPVWDVFLAFGTGKIWESVAPNPSYVMSNMVGKGSSTTSSYPRLNGIELASQVKALLAAPETP